MIILGIDPGTTRIGFGVIESTNNKLSCLDYGIIGHSGGDKFSNLVNVAQQLTQLLYKYRPEAAGVEKLFFYNNQKTAMAVSEARGSMLLVLAQGGVPIYEFTPLEIKQSVSNYGRADKQQVEQMVRLLLGVHQKITPDDAADALAAAICCSSRVVHRRVAK